MNAQQFIYDNAARRTSVASRAGYSPLHIKYNDARRCPVCGEPEGAGFWMGEYEDVGVGYVQVTPDDCQRCGYIQPGNYADEKVAQERRDRVLECAWLWIMCNEGPCGAD